MTLFQLDFFIFMLILMLVVGGFCVVLASSGFGKSRAEDVEENAKVTLDALDSTVSEADEAITELNDMSKKISKEFESKYQELLFLYNLIDEKQKEVASNGEAAQGAASPRSLGAMSEIQAKPQSAQELPPSNPIASNPRFAKVLEFHKSGKSVEEIAASLDMGKGEIGLILTLGGGRGNA
ncbi:MAG: DUF6115 domain-containing protein [Defluviitaleaceae bacterium]|nr:DUF6115 domain-containing protein [Defluviitaleaceae bacterium]